MEWLAVSLGGAMGAVLRHALASAITAQSRSEFPLGIFTVNVLGCFLMAICYVLLVERQLLGDPCGTLHRPDCSVPSQPFRPSHSRPIC
ncbi:MAG: CrcB family protein [Pseudomonadales bacterium]|jgi:fluoride ion exporter CrcB/FEX|nr:CrcB family protein [Pseudomonadales bacterium]